MGTSVERTSNVHELWKLGLSYEMPAWPVDAMNVFTVYEEMKKAVTHVRSGKGPVLLEMNTYRYQGHSMSDPGKYRTKEEMAAYKDLDPVMHLQNHLIEFKVCTAEDLDTIEARVMAKVQASVEFAEASPFPRPEELFEDVYAEPNYPFITE
jgi:pyruvate dehydrogenase E1 component alpha subunit